MLIEKPVYKSYNIDSTTVVVERYIKWDEIEMSLIKLNFKLVMEGEKNYFKTKVCTAKHSDGRLVIVFDGPVDEHASILRNALEHLFSNLNDIMDFESQTFGGGSIICELEFLELRNRSKSLGGPIPDEIVPVVMGEFSRLRKQYLAEIEAENQKQRGS